MVGRDELVDESLLLPSLLDYVLLVVLAKGSAQLVIVHLAPVLSVPPTTCQLMRIFYFKDP